eukprot:858785-Rhodomonas_salina.1
MRARDWGAGTQRVDTGRWGAQVRLEASRADLLWVRGTDAVYGAMRKVFARWVHALPRPCPVLTYAMLRPGLGPQSQEPPQPFL